jgi:hypothetical protein
VKRVPLFLILPGLAGCIFGSGKSSEATKVPEEMKHARPVAPKLPDRHPYGDVARLRSGQWASYREGVRSFTLAAVGMAGDRVWIEVIEEGEPRQVSARLVSPDGVIHKAYYGEVFRGGRTSAVEPQTLEQDGLAAPLRLGETGRETGEETLRVAGRELKTRRVKLRFEDLEGRLTEETTWWNPEVPPIYAGTDAGGLVRRQSGASTLELTGFGNDARPLLEVPR